MIRIIDDDRGEITAELDGREIRGWSYAERDQQRTKMRMAREFAEGWFQATREAVLTRQPDMIASMTATLAECAEFLEGQADVNWEGDGPNRAMSLLNEVNEAIAKANGRQWP